MMGVPTEDAMLRIGELSRRVGVSEHVLRAWENRYGLVAPLRSSGGFRLYSTADEDRVRRMRAYLSAGLSAAEAARTTLAETRPQRDHAARALSEAGNLAGLAADLRDALEALDEPTAQDRLDRLFTDFTVESVLRDAIVPLLRDIGERWERGAVSVAQEHFASSVIRGRLLGLARGWGQGAGPRAVLACPPDEQHDHALTVFGIALSRTGWRINYLGASTPLDELRRVVRSTAPALVVLAAASQDRFRGLEPELRRLAVEAPLALAGAGATRELADAVGACLIEADPVTAATAVTAG